MGKKVFVFGIDGMSPELILKKWREDLPTFRYLMENGIFGRIASTIPPTSIAAWTSFFSGRDPGETGIYHYIKRYNKDRTNVELITADNIKAESLWDILGKKGKKSIALNILQAYPVKPIDGIILSGALTPRFDERALYPYSLKQEILDITGSDYMFEVSDFGKYRDLSYEKMIDGAYKMSEIQFNLVFNFLKNKEWDFFAYTLTGSDVLHHTLWRYMDEKHLKFEPNSKYSNVIFDFYKYLDKKMQELMSLLGNDTTLIVSSDHGMRKLDGRINLNDWLIENGYLVLKKDYADEIKKEIKKFDPKRIDWEKTSAFSTGAYEAMIFVNREVVGGEKYDSFCNGLSSKILAITKEDGTQMKTKIFKAPEIYKNGYDENAPDMIVYFDGLYQGTNSDLGHNSLYSWANLVGADDSLHSDTGTFFMCGDQINKRGDIGTVSILDIVPTILDLYNIEPSEKFLGKIIGYK